MLTLIRKLSDPQRADQLPSVTPGYRMRPISPGDIPALGRVYFEAYEPGIACDTLEEAIEDIQASLDGVYGPWWSQASFVCLRDDRIVAAVMTVRRALWEGTPSCPFIIELFTARAHRRQGLARLLLTRCIRVVEDAGEEAVALRVAAKNRSARRLYESLGFERWG